MSINVQVIKHRGVSPIMRDNEIPFKSGRNAYLASMVAALLAAVVVMWIFVYG